MQCFCWLSGVTDVLVVLDREGSAPPCVPYFLSVCWQGGHGPFWPLALAPLRWLTSFLHNWVRAQIISAYSAALPVSSSTYTKQKWTHTQFQIHIHVYQPWNNAVYTVFFYYYLCRQYLGQSLYLYCMLDMTAVICTDSPCVFNNSSLPELCNAP